MTVRGDGQGGLPGLLQLRALPPERPFLRAGGHVVMTYGELVVQADRYRTALAAWGVQPGDRVAWQLTKSASLLPLHVALLEAGAVQLPLNPAYPDAEVRAVLQDAEPVLVLRDPTRDSLPGTWRSASFDADGQGTFDEAGGSAASMPELSADDGSALLYTSGTTGRPKGAYLSHGNLRHNAEVLVQAWGFSSSDVLLHMLPLFHTHGLFVATHCVLASGASMVMLPQFDVDAALEALSECTVVMGVPTHYTRLLADSRFNRDRTHRLRLIVSGSAPMSPATHAEVLERTGMQVLERYGMTETSMLTSNPLEGRRKAVTVGRPLPGVDVRVVDADNASRPVGEVGHVQVQGPNVFSGYWRRPELADESFTADGWFRTGDLGRLDADGYLELVGRSKDLVITGGMNVYPKDVEVALDEVDGVVESAVVGLPDADFGERVVAAVVVADSRDFDEEGVRTTLRERLAPYQLPKRIYVLDELPRNAMGKVEKTRLRELLAEETL